MTELEHRLLSALRHMVLKDHPLNIEGCTHCFESARCVAWLAQRGLDAVRPDDASDTVRLEEYTTKAVDIDRALEGRGETVYGTRVADAVAPDLRLGNEIQKGRKPC
jgi:hypothetical protein